MKTNKGLTLPEVLFLVFVLVIGFCAFRPLLDRSHIHPEYSHCISNMKTQAISMMIYANENNDRFYTYSGKSSGPREVTFENIRLLKEYGEMMDNEYFVCCSRRNIDQKDDARFWQYSLHLDKASSEYMPSMVDEQTLTEQQRKENYRYLSLLNFTDKTDNEGKSIYGSDFPWKISGLNVKNPDKKPLIVDVVCRDKIGGNYSDVISDKLSIWGLRDSSNHTERDDPETVTGANHAYVDGHVQWVPLSELTEKYTEDNQVYYWK